jgi:hypothetical protein
MRTALPTTLPAALALSLSLSLSAPAQAVEVNSLPFNNSADWTVIVFGGTTMVAGGGQTVLTTSGSVGVWYGNGAAYGDTPAWSLGTNASGNYLSLTASFSGDARDWSAYLYDRTHFASFSFAPTDCNGNLGSCYAAPAYAGVSVSHGAAGDASIPQAPAPDQEALARKLAEDEAAQKAQQEKAQQDAEAARTKNCEIARKNVDVLQSERPVVKTDAEGKKVTISDEQRAQELQKARKDQDYFCNP